MIILDDYVLRVTADTIDTARYQTKLLERLIPITLVNETFIQNEEIPGAVLVFALIKGDLQARVINVFTYNIEKPGEDFEALQKAQTYCESVMLKKMNWDLSIAGVGNKE